MSKALSHAIKLREWTRQADAIDDMDALRRLNRMAIVAADRLNASDRALYAWWCDDTLDDETRAALDEFARALGCPCAWPAARR